MQEAMLEKLRSIVGVENLLEQPSEMEKYLSGTDCPGAVIFPGRTEEVSEVIALCNDLDVKLSVGGHTVNTNALAGGLAMVMSRMNRVLDIDRENLVVEVEAGMSHTLLQQAVAGEGLYFPPEPYKGKESSIGACISAGDLDCKAFIYGPARTYVLGFEMVMPSGEVLNCGGKVIKNVAGYDLIHFIVGSRGTLGVITKVLLKLLPVPECCRTIIGSFASLADAVAVTQKLLERKIFPARLNLLNPPVAAQFNLEPDQPAPGYLVLVDLEGFTASIEYLTEEIAALFRLDGAVAVTLLEEDVDIEKFWAKWLELKEKYHGDAHARAVDFMVGPANAPQALTHLASLVQDIDTMSALIVYVMNGNIRVFPSDAVDSLALIHEVNQLALALGGNLAGDLGFKMKCESTGEEDMWNEMIILTNEIRAQFDPRGIMAPDVNQ